MVKHDVLIGQIDYSVLVFLTDASTGAPKTGLDTTEVDFSYTRVETDNDVVLTGGITPQSLTNLTDAHLDWGFKEVSSTEAPGLYRLDIADAVFASGAWSAVVFIRNAGSNNVAPVALEFQLVGQNPQSAGVNVSQFGGVNGAFSSGRAEVILGNVAHGGTVATLQLKRVDIVNSDSDAVYVESTESASAGMRIVGAQAGVILGGPSYGAFIAADQAGILIDGGSGPGMTISGATGGIEANLAGNITGNLSGSVGSVASGGITNASLATSAVDKIADGVWDEDIVNAGHLEANKAGRALNTLSTVSNRTNSPNLNALLGVPDAAGANVGDAIWDEDVVNAHTEADKAGRCLRTLDAISDRTNNSNLNALLGVLDAAGTNVADAIWDENIVAAHTAADTAGRSLRTLDAISDRTNNSNLNALLGVADSAGANVADAIWDENIVAAHTGVDTAGRNLRTLDAISDRANNSNLNALLGVTDAAGKNVADMVWDELRSDHTSAGSFGQGVASVQGAVTGSVASVATGGISAGSFGADSITNTALADNAASEIRDSVWGATSRTLTSAETRISPTGPTISTTQYTSGDTVGAQLEFSVGASRGVIVGCRVLDYDKESKPLELWLFRASITGSTDNQPFNPHPTTDLPNLFGVMRISDWFDAQANSIGQAENLPLAFADLSMNKIYGWLVTRGTPQYTASTDLKVELEVLPG